MTLEYRSVAGNGYSKIIMTECPLCGRSFAPQDKRPWHFWGEHDMADVGL